MGRPMLARGALVDGPLEELSLLPSSLCGRRAAEVSEEVREFFFENRDLMLRPENLIDRDKMPETPTFWSSSYRSLEARLQLVLALYVSGMIGFTNKVNCLSLIHI